MPWLRRFYFGDGDDDPGLKSLVGDIGDIDAREVSSFPLAGSDIVVRVGQNCPLEYIFGHASTRSFSLADSPCD